MAEGYDRKHKKAPPKSDEWRKQHNKKNTKAWCKGKVGREHVSALVEEEWYVRNGHSCKERAIAFPWMRVPNTKMRWFCIHQQVCLVCNKVLKHNLRIEECPVYVEKYGIED